MKSVKMAGHNCLETHRVKDLKVECGGQYEVL